eukprot:4247475-Ditylum_brightwellii.AAC.1
MMEKLLGMLMVQEMDCHMDLATLHRRYQMEKFLDMLMEISGGEVARHVDGPAIRLLHGLGNVA